MFSLRGKLGLIVGVANDHSIAYGCAKAFRQGGADLAITYLNPKSESYVRPLAEQLGAQLILPLDVEKPGELEAVFEAIQKQWGRLDFLVHSIAFAPKEDLHGRVTDCSREGFSRAMDISCHSFMRMAKLAEPLMMQGGCLLTMSYHGADEVVANYGMMGPVKAALQSATRYVASELGPKGIRVHAISPGPLATRAASGIKNFDNLMQSAAERAPLHKLVDIDDVGALCAYLVSDGARSLTGGTIHVDGGYNIID
ncbi:enoyl-ACP reductase FabI [Uliginosibacterium sp. 31-16]|uniref:enoyl-ACP reductase FabI n=1 Tax=Uliginosibacterium sp. 31-16 TaxID=3068315 RepID=UPI00273D09DF|nr:enoyl-ACP reductase FabI [Uliginosibacterium sp. 31-16]MDP5240964.1 enoyl-ACP reductase FabI [Uliginosibacterium sp. 31-16]